MPAFLPHPLLIEFTFAETASPAGAGLNPDARELAVWLGELTVREVGDEAILARLRWEEGAWRGGDVLYGLADDHWTVGRRAAVLLRLERPPRGPLTLQMEHGVFQGLGTAAAELKINARACGTVTFAGGSVEVPVPDTLLFPHGPRSSSNVSRQVDGTPRVSVVVTTAGRDDLVYACVAALAGGVRASAYEIIVANNGGPLQGLSALVEAGLDLRLVELGRRRSYAEANNCAIDLARGDYVLLLNDDAFVQPGAVDALVQALDADEAVGAACPSLLFPGGVIQELGASLGPEAAAAHRGRGGAEADLQAIALDPVCDTASAACLMVRRADLIRLGGFDPAFDPAYWEDVDLCLRLRGLGKTIRWVREAVVLHLESASTDCAHAPFDKDAALALNRLTFLSRWSEWLGSDEVARGQVLNGAPSPPREADHLDVALSGHEAPVRIRAARLDAQTLAIAAALSRSRSVVVETPEVESVVQHGPWLAALGARVANVALRTPLDARPAAGDAAVLVLSTAEACESEPTAEHPGLIMGWVETPQGARPFELSAPLVLQGVRTASPWSKRPRRVVFLGSLRACRHGLDPRAAANAFLTFQAQDRAEWTFAAAGPIGLGDDLAEPDRLWRSLGDPHARVLANPPRTALSALLAQAAIVVLATERWGGGGEVAEGIDWVAEAAAAGATVVVPAQSDLAAACDALDCGLTFDTPEEFVEALHLAADGVRAPDAATRARIRKARGWTTFQRALEQSVEGRAAKPRPPRRASVPPSRGAAVVVLGAHRSGTSALTRVLAICGAALPAGLMSPQSDNPTGHWEPLKVTRLNDRILAALGTRWDDVFVGSALADQATLLERWLTPARRTLRETYPANGLIVLKDPRITVLAPLWREALRLEGWTPRFVLTRRLPQEVAASLSARSGMPREQGLLLWAAYMLAGEASLREGAGAVVDYADLLSDPVGAVSKLVATLDLPDVDPARAGGGIEAFLTHELRHHRGGRELPPAFAPVETLYAALAEQPLSQPAQQRIQGVRAWFETLAELFRPVLDATRQAADGDPESEARGRLADAQRPFKLVMTLLVRDEEDILRQHLDFHIAQGVDFFIITDNASVDGTARIVDDYVRAGVAERIWEPQDDYSQARWVTRMARRASTAHAADWVINSDADEFWRPREGRLRDELSRVAPDCEALEVQRYNHLPVAGMQSRGLASMTFREQRSFNALGQPLQPKVCHRAFPDVEVSQGNHFVSRRGEVLDAQPCASISISHFPVRDYASFERKIVNGGAAYGRNTELDPAIGAVWRRLYEVWRQGELRAWYGDQLIDEEQLAQRLANGALVEDDFLRRALKSGGRT